MRRNHTGLFMGMFRVRHTRPRCSAGGEAVEIIAHGLVEYRILNGRRAGSRSAAQRFPDPPGVPVAVLHELLRYPLDVVGSDREVRPVGPKAGGVEAAKRPPGLAHRNHASCRRRIESAPTLQPTASSDSSEVIPYIVTHGVNVSRLCYKVNIDN